MVNDLSDSKWAVMVCLDKEEDDWIFVTEDTGSCDMFNMQPVGKYVLEVCVTGPCMLRGSDDIVNYIKEKLGIKAGETTADGLFTLKPAECLGACGYAPMMQLGKFYHENLTKEKVDEILELCRQGQIALD